MVLCIYFGVFHVGSSKLFKASGRLLERRSFRLFNVFYLKSMALKHKLGLVISSTMSTSALDSEMARSYGFFNKCSYYGNQGLEENQHKFLLITCLSQMFRNVVSPTTRSPYNLKVEIFRGWAIFIVSASISAISLSVVHVSSTYLTTGPQNANNLSTCHICVSLLFRP